MVAFLAFILRWRILMPWVRSSWVGGGFSYPKDPNEMEGIFD